jgi:hypothetical protein
MISPAWRTGRRSEEQGHPPSATPGRRFQAARPAQGRRPLHRRHRAPREPPHRQPAARPLRPPGRPRPLQVLPVAAGRPDAHLRLGPHGRHADQARPQGGRGHRPSLDQQGAGEGAAEGRGAQLRHAQEHPQIRRRHERPAQGRVRAAHRASCASSVSRPSHDMRHGVDRDAGDAPTSRPDAYPEQWDTAALKRGDLPRSSTSTCPSRSGPRKRASPTRRCASASRKAADEDYAARKAERNGPDR